MLRCVYHRTEQLNANVLGQAQVEEQKGFLFRLHLSNLLRPSLPSPSYLFLCLLKSQPTIAHGLTPASCWSLKVVKGGIVLNDCTLNSYVNPYLMAPILPLCL